MTDHFAMLNGSKSDSPYYLIRILLSHFPSVVYCIWLSKRKSEVFLSRWGTSYQFVSIYSQFFLSIQNTDMAGHIVRCPHSSTQLIYTQKRYKISLAWLNRFLFILIQMFCPEVRGGGNCFVQQIGVSMVSPKAESKITIMRNFVNFLLYI